jgi:hypothetical protein
MATHSQENFMKASLLALVAAVVSFGAISAANAQSAVSAEPKAQAASSQAQNNDRRGLDLAGPHAKGG